MCYCNRHTPILILNICGVATLFTGHFCLIFIIYYTYIIIYNSYTINYLYTIFKRKEREVGLEPTFGHIASFLPLKYIPRIINKAVYLTPLPLLLCCPSGIAATVIFKPSCFNPPCTNLIIGFQASWHRIYLAKVEGFEPSSYGFGDRYFTIKLHQYINDL